MPWTMPQCGKYSQPRDGRRIIRSSYTWKTLNKRSGLTRAWPEAAERLAAQFWPGPLSLVLPKRDHVPDIVTAGSPTVALRVPAHPVARALLQAAAVPIAAPSANRANGISPTTAEHVRKALESRVRLILDAGPTAGGLESTVLDLAGERPRLLRPGLVTPEQIQRVIGAIDRRLPAENSTSAPLLSPGNLPRHYAPAAAMELHRDESAAARVEALLARKIRIGWLTFVQPQNPAGAIAITMPTEPAPYAARLYAALHELDDAAVERIIVELPPEGSEWLAIHDRLRRGATPEQNPPA